MSPENGEDGALNDTVASTIPEEASTDDGDGPIEPERSDQSSDQAHTARDEILKLRETVRRLENELSGKDKEVSFPDTYGARGPHQQSSLAPMGSTGTACTTKSQGR